MTIKGAVKQETIIELIRSLIEDKGMLPEKAIREVELSFSCTLPESLKHQIKWNFK